MSENSARRPFQFRLSTALVAMVLLSLLTGEGLWVWKRYVLNVSLELEQMDTADAKADVADSWALSDYRFVGVYGLGLSVTGIDESHREKYGAKPIRGTSDCYRSNEQARLQEKAVKYAAEYNRLMLEKILAKETSAKP